MKRHAAILTATLLLCAAPAYAADTLSGTWAVQTQVPVTCSFTQKDKVLTGTCQGPSNQGPITGSVDGKKVTWSWTVSANGLSFTREFSGQWDLKNAVSGQMKFTGLPAGAQTPEPITFTATRQPAK